MISKKDLIRVESSANLLRFMSTGWNRGSFCFRARRERD